MSTTKKSAKKAAKPKTLRFDTKHHFDHAGLAVPTQQAFDALAARVSFLEGAVSMLREILGAHAPAAPSSVGSFASNAGMLGMAHEHHVEMPEPETGPRVHFFGSGSKESDFGLTKKPSTSPQ